MPIPEGIAAFGALAGFLGFLVGTVEKLASAADTYRKAKRYLQQYEDRLRVCHRRLSDWEKKWENDRSVQPRSVWGEQGALDLQNRKSDIKCYLDQIWDLLIGNAVKQAVGDLIDEWTKFLNDGANTVLQSRPTRTLQSEHVNITVFKQVALVLYENKLLDDNISKLAKAIDDLEYMAKSYYRETHGHKYTEVKEAKTAERVRQRAEKLLHAMGHAFEKLGGACHTWALMFTFPEEPMKQKLEDREELQVDLLHTPDGFKEDQKGCQQSLACYLEEDRDEIQNHIDYQLEQPRQEGCDITLTMTLKYFLSYIAKTPAEEIQRAETGTSHLRAKLALCIATWATLGWHCHWIGDLCSCRIRHAKLGNDQRVPVFSPEHRHEPIDCSDPEFHEEPHLLLGLILAELALARPVCARNNPEDVAQRFRVWDYNLQDIKVLPSARRTDGLRYRDLNNQQIAKEVGLWAKAVSYRECVTYCFNLSQNKSREQPAGVFLREYLEMVVEPLHRYYDVIETQRNKQPELYDDVEKQYRF